MSSSRDRAAVRLFGQGGTDNNPLDFTRPFVNFGDFGIPHHPFNREFTAWVVTRIAVSEANSLAMADSWE
jgi:hypothetical protein